MTCECSKLDWSEVDQTAAHHPACGLQKNNELSVPLSFANLHGGYMPIVDNGTDLLLELSYLSAPDLAEVHSVTRAPTQGYYLLHRKNGEIISETYGWPGTINPTPTSTVSPMWTVSSGSVPITGAAVSFTSPDEQERQHAWARYGAAMSAQMRARYPNTRPVVTTDSERLQLGPIHALMVMEDLQTWAFLTDEQVEHLRQIRNPA